MDLKRQNYIKISVAVKRNSWKAANTSRRSCTGTIGKHQDTYIINSKYFKRTKKINLLFGAEQQIKAITGSKDKKGKINILQNVNIMFKGGKEETIVNFWQVKCRIIGGQTKKQLW